MKKSCEQLYACAFENCSAVFKRQDRLDCHARTHTGERPFVCPHEDCIKSYARASHLKRHEAIHLEKKYKCNYEGCGLELKTVATLKKHTDYMHKHKKPKTFKCSHCDKEFNKHSWLRVHEFKHTKIKPYVCPEKGCGKQFLVPSKLKRHSKVHKGYKCDRKSCKKVLPTWGLFRKHVKLAHSHALKCKSCGEVFSTAWNLQEHEATHVVPAKRILFKCPKENCPRSYFASRNLTHHIKHYHDMRPFKCTSEGCYLCFKEEAHLRKHLRFHDPNLPLPSKKKKKIKPSIAHKLSGLSIEDAKKYENLLVAGTSISDDVNNADTSVPDDVENADTSTPDVENADTSIPDDVKNTPNND